MSQQIPNDIVLKEVAERAQRRDWKLLATELKLSSDDISSFERNNPQDVQNQVITRVEKKS